MVKFSSPVAIPSGSELLHDGASSSSASKNLEQPPPVVSTDRVVVVEEVSVGCQKVSPASAPALRNST